MNQNNYSNNDLLFKEFDYINENKKFIIHILDNNNISLIIESKNSNDLKTIKYETNLNKEQMTNDDKFNLLYNQIKFINNKNSLLENNSEIKNINNKIKKTNLCINKKEDDLKNLINNIIIEMNNKLETLNKQIQDLKENIKKEVDNKIILLKDKLNDLIYGFNDKFYLSIEKLRFKKNIEIIYKINSTKKIIKKNSKSQKLFGFIEEKEIPNFFKNFKKEYQKIQKSMTTKNLNLG